LAHLPEEYYKEAHQLDIQYVGLPVTDYIFAPDENFELKEVPTYYHGICTMFKVKKQLRMNEYLGFVISEGKQKLLFNNNCCLQMLGC